MGSNTKNSKPCLIKKTKRISLSKKKKKKTKPTPRLHVLGPRLIETYIDPKKKKLHSIIPES